MGMYIKGGLITRIDIFDYDDRGKELIDKFFDFDLLTKKDNSYFIKKDIFDKEFKNLRMELLSLTNEDSDCFRNSEAYVLGTTIDKLISNKVYLTDDYTEFYFENYKDVKFDTIYYRIRYRYLSMNIYFITLIWDIDKVYCEDEYFFNLLVNNLVRKALTNKLKYLTWFTVTS